MSKITIRVAGRYTIIASREEAGISLPAISDGFEKQAGRITRISSTEAQPYVGANFTEDGTFVGGMTMSESYRAAAIKKAREIGATIEEA